MTTYFKKWLWNNLKNQKEARLITEELQIIFDRIINSRLRLNFLNNSILVRVGPYDIYQ